MEMQSLLFESSPFGSVDAMVQQDSRSCYLYLHAPKNPSFGTRAAWVRNLVKGPLVLNRDDMDSGIPPLLPRTYCAHPQGGAALDSTSLRLVWLEEGNGVALLEDDDVLAIIPPWSGLDGFHSYARDCRIKNELCSPLHQESHLLTRVHNGDLYWKRWLEEKPFQDFQPAWIGKLSTSLGTAEQYYSIDGGKWPPRGIQAFQSLDQPACAVTVGMSLCSMPNVELSVEQPAGIRRIELGVQIPPDADNASILRWMSGLSHYPWTSFSWFGHGDTSRIPEGLFGEYAGVFFCHDRHRQNLVDSIRFQDEPINLLWLIPIYKNEMESLSNNLVRSPEFVAHLIDEGRLG